MHNSHLFKLKYLLKMIALMLLAFSMVGCLIKKEPKPDDPFYAPPIAQIPVPLPAGNGSLFQANLSASLFIDDRARRIGDIITVVLDERTNAVKRADTTIDKENKVTIPNPTFFGSLLSPSLGTTIDAQREFEAETDSTQSNRLDGTVTVTVTGVLPNGNMLIRGEKWININRGKEFLRITGIIRPQDIRPDNSIMSSRIANARIAYSGTGAAASSNNPGWLAKVMLGAIWPF